MSRTGKIIARGVIPPIAIIIIFFTCFSAFAIGPDLPPNCTKLGIPVYSGYNQTEGTPMSWKAFDTCPTCGTTLYYLDGLSVPISSSYGRLLGSYFFASNVQYSSAAYRYSTSGFIAGGMSIFGPGEHDRLKSYYFAIVELDLTPGYTGPIPSNNLTIVSHLIHTVEEQLFMFSYVPSTHQYYDDIALNFNEYVIDYGSTRYDLATAAVTFFSVPIYQDLLDDLQSDEVTNAYQRGYNAGQINATKNGNAFDLIGDVFDNVASTILATFNQISFFNISLTFIVFLFVLFTLLSLFLKLR